MGAERVDEVREAFAVLTRSLKRVSIYRHASEQHASYLEPALIALARLLAHEPRLALGVEPDGFTWKSQSVYGEAIREQSLCFRLHQAGVRELHFLQGLSFAEFRTFVGIAMPDALGADTGREDALTELWKAELTHVQYRAVDLYRSAGGDGRLAEAVAWAKAALAQESQRIPKISEQRATRMPPLEGGRDIAGADGEPWQDLAGRTALTLLAIVEARFAGRDLDSLREAFLRLLAEMLRRGETLALRDALETAAQLQGTAASEFRGPLAARLGEPKLLEHLAGLGDTPEALKGAIPAWLALLAPEASITVLDALTWGTPGSRPILARAAAAHLESCRGRYVELLRTGPDEIARILIAALDAVPPSQGAAVAAAALGHPDVRVVTEAIARVALDAKQAAHRLSALLDHREAPVRVAAAEALGRAQAEGAAALLLSAMGRPEFERSERAEREAFYRALGALGSDEGFAFLAQRLSRTAGRFKKARVEEEQLLAVRGLAAENSPRVLQALETALRNEGELAPALAAACRAAAHHVRTHLSPPGVP